MGWDPATPRSWAHIRGRYWSAKIDDISLWPSDLPTVYMLIAWFWKRRNPYLLRSYFCPSCLTMQLIADTANIALLSLSLTLSSFCRAGTDQNKRTEKMWCYSLHSAMVELAMAATHGFRLRTLKHLNSFGNRKSLKNPHHKGLNTNKTTLVFFLAHPKPLQSYR